MIEPVRLLAFAFAGADLLFEVDRDGLVLFAAGAPSSFYKSPELAGLNAALLFASDEKFRFSILIRGMSPGQRAGPLPMTLASGEKANLSLCYLPQSDRISCTLVKPGKRKLLTGGTDKATGLPDGNAFLLAAGSKDGGNLALVNLSNFTELCGRLTPDANAGLLKDIGENIKSIGASAAARLSPTAFGVISDDPDAAKTLSETLQNTARARGIQTLEAEEALVSLKGRELTPEQSMLALRHVVGRFAEGKLKTAPGADLSQVFEQMIGDTIARAMSFNATIADGDFNIAYEPIVDLKTGKIHHYEALSRFKNTDGPAETIRFAEEMGLADNFDLAVAVKVLTAIEQAPDFNSAIAINVSGRTLSDPASFAMLSGLLNKKRALAGRVMIELTETAEITDMVETDKAIQSLRILGYNFGIDDFGAGAASLHYLHGFTVDFIKTDGSLIQTIGRSARDDAILRSIIASCKELGIATIAEWIDSPEKMTRCAEIGFDYGQGRHFGRGLTELPRPVKGPVNEVVQQRRRGEDRSSA